MNIWNSDPPQKLLLIICYSTEPLTVSADGVNTASQRGGMGIKTRGVWCLGDAPGGSGVFSRIFVKFTVNRDILTPLSKPFWKLSTNDIYILYCMHYMPSLSMCFMVTLKLYEICLANYNHGVYLTRSLLPISQTFSSLLLLTLKINMTWICITVLW